jgi:hypothetical protein
MVLQERDIDVLSALARYFMLNSRQIRELCFTDDANGRITRRRLNKMVQAGYLRKRSVQVVSPRDGSTCPVYHLTKLGREFLAGHYDDAAFLLKPVEPAQPQHLYHYIAVAETHRLFDRAIARAGDEVQLQRWHHEEQVLNPDDADSSKRLYLRTEFPGTSKVICMPDAGFVLQSGDHAIAVYLEQDRDTFFHERVAARKSPGYQKLLALRGHRLHFPETTLDHFFVLVMAPSRKRADQLRRAFAKRNRDTEIAKCYRFGAFEELTDTNLFFEPMYTCCHHDDRVRLVKKLPSPYHTTQKQHSPTPVRDG